MNLVKFRHVDANSSIFSTSVPLVPFSVPHYVLEDEVVGEVDISSVYDEGFLREVRRVMAFLLERPHGMTPQGTMELVSMLVEIAGALEEKISAVAALLKVQFSGLIYSYDPVLCHVVLMLYARFTDSFAGDDEIGIGKRLSLIPKDVGSPLVFRLLALHWLMGSPRLGGSKELLAQLVPNFYPNVFDPLALKASKLEAIARVVTCYDKEDGGKDGNEAYVVKLFNDGLACVSAFKWLPPWSTETDVAFRTLYKFLTGVDMEESVLFGTLQSMLVNLALEHSSLVPVIASFVDRLSQCEAHKAFGERFLQTFDEHLLPKLEADYHLISYLPLFERISVSDAVPPHVLLELLTKQMIFLTEKHSSDTKLRTCSQGSKLLSVCRLMLTHHHSSRIYTGLSRLLAFTCQYFPDLEVRDNARIYLRMLLCIPGKKLHRILGFAERIPGVAASHTSSFFQDPSLRPSHNLMKPTGQSSYIHLERVIPVLVKQSWALSIPNLNAAFNESDGISDIITTNTNQEEAASPSPSIQDEVESEVGIKRITMPPEPLRVMDSAVAEILGILRRHFSLIPDYRHMPPIKIFIPCSLRFESEEFNRVWGTSSSTTSESEDDLPALYAIKISFSSSAKYGKIPPCRVPFLLGEPPNSGSETESSYQALVNIELEPRDPMPGIIDVTLEANLEDGQIINTSLQSISIGIEDMFLTANVPSDLTRDEIPDYYLDLFNALWEACGNSANIGRETFILSGGKGVAAINGTRSVKLLEVKPTSLINGIEQYLARFVVRIIGEPLINMFRSNGVVKDVIWGDDSGSSSDVDVNNANALVPYSEQTTLQLQYVQDEKEGGVSSVRKRNLGVVLVLIFLPPRYHLLFQMEINEATTLVRIRTDHWPSLAYVDEYLESLFLT